MTANVLVYEKLHFCVRRFCNEKSKYIKKQQILVKH